MYAESLLLTTSVPSLVLIAQADKPFLPRDAILARYMLSSCVRLSVGLRPSVTSRCSTKTAKRRITQTMPYDSPGTQVF